MASFIIKRVLKAIVTIWFILTIVFVLTRLTGDPTEYLLPDDASEEVKMETRISLGLEDPIHIQYIDYLSGLFTSDMGESYYYKRPVGELFAERIGPTLKIGVTSFIITMMIGIPIGIIAAVKRNTLFERLTISTTVVLDALPNFVLGILLIFIFSLHLRLLPSGGLESYLGYIMPIAVLSVNSVASIARITRSSMLDVLGQDYLNFAMAKGIHKQKIILKHALRNALIPVVTVAGLQVASLISGAVVVETVFAFPGIGSLIISAAQQRDFPVIQFGVMLIAVMVTLMNTLVDISYGYLDPRIRTDV